MHMFYIYIGLRGSGKTSHAAYIAHKNIKKGIKVFSNVPISGTYQYTVEELGNIDISNGVLIYDEAGIDMSNRSFSSKKSVVNTVQFRSFWKLSRHYKLHDIYVYSQAWDFDAGVRRLCDRMFIVRNSILPDFSILKPVKPKWDTDDDGQPTIKWTIGGFPIPFYRRPYYKYYDSYACDPLPSKDMPIIPYSLKNGKMREFVIKQGYRIRRRSYNKSAKTQPLSNRRFLALKSIFKINDKHID